MQAYVLDSSQQANYEAATAPFDYAVATGLWSFAFSFVIACYMTAHGVGVILQRIKK